MGHINSKEIKASMKKKLEERNPDLLLYIDNDYISELVDCIFEVVAEEINDLKQNTVQIDKYRRRY